MFRHIGRTALPRPAELRARSIFGSAAVSSAAAFLTSLLKPVGICYALTVAIALAAQRKLQYFPTAEKPGPASLAHPMFSSIEEHEVRASDGTRCYLWHWPAPALNDIPMQPFYLREPQASAAASTMAELRREHPQFQGIDVVQFHGNAGSRMHRLAFMHLLRDGLGCSVTVLDYRGFGGSEGSPTEHGLIADGRAAYDWVRARQAADQRLSSTIPMANIVDDSSPVDETGRYSGRRHVVLWGESIGSGVAVALLDEEIAKQPAPARAPSDTSLVLEAGFSSCVDLGAHAYPWLPVRLGMLDRFESEGRARRMAAALGNDDAASFASLALHGDRDEIAPLEFGQRLHDALPGGKRKRIVVLPQTGHNDIAFVDTARYLREIADFFAAEVVARKERSADGSTRPQP